MLVGHYTIGVSSAVKIAAFVFCIYFSSLEDACLSTILSSVAAAAAASAFLTNVDIFVFQARRAQEPITLAGKDLIDGACNMVLAAKQLAINPRDPPIYQAYSTHSHSVSEAIKRLVSAVRYVLHVCSVLYH